MRYFVERKLTNCSKNHQCRIKSLHSKNIHKLLGICLLYLSSFLEWVDGPFQIAHPHIRYSPHVQSSPHIRSSTHVWLSHHNRLSPLLMSDHPLTYNQLLTSVGCKLCTQPNHSTIIDYSKDLSEEPIQGIHQRNLSKDPVLIFGQMSRKNRSLFSLDLKFLLKPLILTLKLTKNVHFLALNG